MTQQTSGAGLSTRLVVLLTAAMLINYADRGSLSVVAPLLKDRLSLSNGQIGVLLSAFFWSYAVVQPAAGAIAQRYSPRVVMAAGLATWAGATALCGLAGGFVSLLFLRLLVGLGESVIFPSTARVLAEHAPDDRRGEANGVILLGMFLGPVLGTYVGGEILAQFGWRAVFMALGGLSLLWLVPWLGSSLGPVSEAAAKAVASPPPYAQILRRRGLWGASLGQFCYAYNHYLLLTWLPLFLVKAEHYSLAAMAGVGAAIYGAQSAGSLIAGWASDAMIRRGADPSAVRKRFILAAVAGAAASMGAASLGLHAVVLPALFAAGFCNGATSPMVFTIGQTLAGPRAGGRWMGIQNTFGQIAGIGAPIITGLLVDATGAFNIAFELAAGLSVVGFAFWALLVPKVRPVAWDAASAPAGLATQAA
jgi:MFS family permease